MNDPIHGPARKISSSPWALRVDGNEHGEEVFRWRDVGYAVRVARGSKMRNLQGLFDEVSAAMQFPDYFGENWAAFDECISDLDWLEIGTGLAVIVLGPGVVLVDEPRQELERLVQSFAAAAEVFAQPIQLGEPWDRPAIPFRIVLEARSADAAAVRERWEGAGADLGE